MTAVSCQKDAEKSIKNGRIPKVSEKEIYAFANSIVNENGIAKYCENVLDRKTMIATNGDSLFLAKIDTIFDKKDLEFIREQYLEGNKFVWKKDLLNKEIINLDSAKNYKNPEEFYNKTLSEKKCIGHIDLPMFNREMNIAIVEISYYCGFLCAQGGIFIYKKDKNKKWKLYKTLEQWIS